MRHRDTMRVIPKIPITVAIEEGGRRSAYGVVANISESGACIWTDGRFGIGDSVRLRLSFSSDQQTIEAPGTVVWGDLHAAERAASLRYGLKWTHRSVEERDRLRRLIATTR